MPFTLDYTAMTEPAVPAGVREADWPSLAERFREAHRAVAATAATGVYGYRELEAQRAERGRVVAFARSVSGRYDDIVVLGIGGSSLGAIALRTALLPPAWNARSAGQRAGRPRLHVLDNVDPRTMAGVLAIIDLPRTLFVVISKSGGTIETLAQSLVARERVAQAGLPVEQHFAFVTDPAKGALRAIARRDGIPAFDVPANVGGRFSVLSPVGTLPAALCGIDVEALCAGAAVMRDATMGDVLEQNSAGLFAALQWRAHVQAGQGMHVMMPYSDALRDLAPWFVQLWAESLGKVDADGLNVGPTPIASVGATDQHSQVQLFMEGPADKTVTFLRLEQTADEVRIPNLEPGEKALGFLGGHSLGELLDVECRATAGALARAGRPSMTMTVGAANAWHLGGLMMWLMQATTLAGALYRVNPLDQPGVELGKRLANAELGHPDYATAEGHAGSSPRSSPRFLRVG
ncbi:MAG: glucose-6-phosphate isomerase [Gemmatimonadaceae bacterium]|nr:glucose-6-phosphate isomerase [Gemmatimonadaceae bacterium]